MNAKEQLVLRQHAQVKSLFKGLLTEVEELHDEFNERFCLLQDKLPQEYLPLLYVANPFTEDKLMRLRKKILDSGNDVIRAMTQDVERYTVSFVFPQNG